MKPEVERCQVIDIQKQVEEKVQQEQEKYEVIEPKVSSLSSQEILKGLKNNEDGDAWLFRKLKKDRLCFDHGKRLWHVWSGNYWVEDDVDNALAEIESVVDAYASEANRQASLKIENTKNGNQEVARRAENLEKELLARISLLQTVRRKKNILILASSGEGSLGISGDEWDSDPFLLGCKNAVVDLRTGISRDGMPGDYIKTVAPTDWMGLHAQAPCFEKTLREIFNDDQQVIDFVQRLFGLAMSGLSNERIFPILIGSGHNGKGTIFETISEVTGELSGPIQAEMLLKQSFTRSSAGPSPDIMSLQGKRLVWASETEEGRQLNVAKVKWLVGGDTLVGRHIQGKKEIKFKPTHTLFLMTNNEPVIPHDDPAIWDRVMLIRFPLSFVNDPSLPNERKRDPFLKEKLLKEGPGILAWLVRGFMEYFNHGLNPPDAVRVETKKYQESEDILGQFVKECCILGKDLKEQAGQLYKAHKTWCETNSYTPLGSRKFGEKMVEKFDRIEEGCRFYKGIKLNIVVT